MITIAIANNKGGVSKTTTACCLAYMLAERGRKVLLVDMDSQGNATRSYGITPSDYDICTYHLFLDQIRLILKDKSIYKAQEAIIKTDYGVDLLPSDNRLSEIPTWLQENGSKFKTGSEIENLWKRHFPKFLINILKEVKTKYDRVVIDTPPAFEYNTKTALLASNYVIIPVELGELELTGLENISARIDNFKESVQIKGLSVLGVVINRYEGGIKGARTNVEKALEEDIRNHSTFGNIVFNTVIYRNTAVREAAVLGKLAVVYKKKGAKSVRDNYYNFTEEVELRLAKYEAAVTNQR